LAEETSNSLQLPSAATTKLAKTQTSHVLKNIQLTYNY